jgi:hypothetical protein
VRLFVPTAFALDGPEHNPFLGEHVVYLVVLFGISSAGVGRFLGCGRVWERFGFVKRHPSLV